MNTKLLFVIAAVVSVMATITTVEAAPLPNGTKLIFEKSPDGPLVQAAPCPNGSCFSIRGFAFHYSWTPLGPGSDGGIIIGKGQLSGGQETNGYSTNNGELTEVWVWGSNYGTFSTSPNAGNIFDDASCSGSGCIGKTELKVWNMAWGASSILVGSANGCNPVVTPDCTSDHLAGIFVKYWTINPVEGGAWSLIYSQVITEVFPNFTFDLVLRGTVHFPQNFPPTLTTTPATLTGNLLQPIRFSITVTDPDGPGVPTCRVGTPPTKGTVVLTGCTAGTYLNTGLSGTDSFTLIAHDGTNDSTPYTVTVNVIGLSASNVNISGVYGVPIAWTPIVTNASSCQIFSYPSHGVASVANDCSTGNYTANVGFVGTDSFSYQASFSAGGMSGHSPPATVTAAITAPDTDPNCTGQYPVRQVSLSGRQGNITAVITGNIISVNPNGKEIKICPTTTPTYEASTNTPGATVICKVKSNTTRGKGRLKVNDHIKCTDKPVGNDKMHVKIKSGVNQKAL